MAWSENDLLEMMQRFPKIFGEEITHIKAADDLYLITHFEKRLAELLNWEKFMRSPYSETEYEGKGDIKNISLRKEGFGLNKKQCVRIGEFILTNVCYDQYGKLLPLDELCSVVVLNYILHGYHLFKGYYNIEYIPPQGFSSY